MCSTGINNTEGMKVLTLYESFALILMESESKARLTTQEQFLRTVLIGSQTWEG
jgi:hypothetical protein